MAPPQLARDAPVADVVHPLEVGLGPIRRNERDAAVFHCGDGGLGERLHLHPPLLGNQRLHHRPAAMAFADTQLVRLDLFEQPERFELRHHLLARLETVQAGELARRRGHLARLRRSPGCCGRSWRLPASKSLGSCAGVIFTAPEPNSRSAISSRTTGISRSVSGSFTVLPVQLRRARIFRIDRDRGVAQHRFRAASSRPRASSTAVNRIANVPQAALASLRAPLRDRRARSGSAGTS